MARCELTDVRMSISRESVDQYLGDSVPGVSRAKSRAMVYAAFLGGLAACGVLVQGVRWRGNAELHTLIETVCALLALMGGAIALTRYYTRKTARYLLLGSGLIGATLLDSYHAMMTSSFLMGQTASAHVALTPWSGLAPPGVSGPAAVL